GLPAEVAPSDPMVGAMEVDILVLHGVVVGRREVDDADIADDTVMCGLFGRGPRGAGGSEDDHRFSADVVAVLEDETVDVPVVASELDVRPPAQDHLPGS